MCIAIAKPSGAYVTNKHLKTAWNNNPDGAGFAFITKKGSVRIKKGYMTFKAFQKDYYRLVGKDTTAIIHFRIATSGGVNKRNTHPWFINQNCALIHNGVMSHVPLIDEELSDTGNFVRYFMKNINKRFLASPMFIPLTEKQIGYGNKLVILHSEFEKGIIIVNENSGVWHDGCWFSNTSFKPTSTRGKANTIGCTYSGDAWEDYLEHQYGGTVKTKHENDFLVLEGLCPCCFQDLEDEQDEEAGICWNCASFIWQTAPNELMENGQLITPEMFNTARKYIRERATNLTDKDFGEGRNGEEIECFDSPDSNWLRTYRYEDGVLKPICSVYIQDREAWELAQASKGGDDGGDDETSDNLINPNSSVGVDTGIIPNAGYRGNSVLALTKEEWEEWEKDNQPE